MSSRWWCISSKSFTVAPDLINLIDLIYKSDLSNHFIWVYLIIRVWYFCIPHTHSETFRSGLYIHNNISMDFHSDSNHIYTVYLHGHLHYMTIQDMRVLYVCVLTTQIDGWSDLLITDQRTDLRIFFSVSTFCLRRILTTL